MGLITPARLTSQPQQPPQINWANPITRGLVGFVDPASRRLISLGSHSPLSGGGSVSSTSKGLAIATDGTGTWSTSAKSIFGGQPALSSFTVLSANDAAAGGVRSYIRKNAEFLGLQLIDVSTARTIVWTANGRFDSVSYAIPSGQFFTHSVIYDGLALSVYVNGSQVSTGSASGLISATASPLCFGGSEAGGEFGAMQMPFCAFWSRGLTNADRASLAANPWQIFRNPQRRLLFDAPAGGTNTYSYTAAGGFVLSGVATKVRGAARAASGGITTGGTAGAARGVARSTSGGLTFAGAANQAKGRKINAAGGLTLGGAVTILRGVARTASGGVLFAGQAGVSFSSAVQSLIVTPVGGIVFAGAALVMRGARKAASGGLSLAGRAGTTFFPPVIVIAVKGILPIFARRRRRK